MNVKADKWTITITQAEIEDLIREKTGQEFPDCYLACINMENDLITFVVIAE